ncbi:MAG: hypothetical protein R3B37_12710 [Nitrospira sp.]|nr:hypothetical protein [Nitrospira sp.]
MSATMMTIPSVTKNTYADRSRQCDAACCTRCGGLLVDERCMDIGESLGGYWFMAMRCIQCGDLIDEVILRNRYAQLPANQEIVRAA